jgi:opacity protein-like surface antigen
MARKEEKRLTQQQILKQIAGAILGACMSLNDCYAVAPGFYMGVMTGPATNTAGTQYIQVGENSVTRANPKSTQWGSRLFMGYKINQYAGTEGGLSLYSKVDYATNNVDPCSTAKARVRTFDVVGKGSFPIASAFDIFGKAGVALTYLTTTGSLNPDLSKSCGKSQYVEKFRPTVSVGASYDLSQNWVVDFSLNRIMVGGAVSNVDLYALGISYHFVDVYCGQFLC